MAEQSSPIREVTSADELAQILLDRGLVSSEEIDEAREGVAGSASTTDASALARRLVESGRLTEYQLRLVRERKTSELVMGNYDLLDRLGAGAMGTVFKARHRRMKRIVAVKLLARALADDGNYLQRFQREIETIAQLNHPNIVMAFDADVAEAGHFLVMEYVNGRDLESMVSKGGPLDVAVAVDCVTQAARGLECAHGQGIIHRDIKPANLLRDTLGIVKVTDLGLARFRDTAASLSLTQAGGVVGTAYFMPPEQAIDATRIDHRADIYSLGATLHFLLTAQPPFPERSLAAALLKHRDAPIPSLMAVRKDVPAALDAIFRRMLAKSPADRYQTMTEVVQALEPVQASLGAAPSPMDQGPVDPAHQAGFVTAIQSNENIGTSLDASKWALSETVIQGEASPRPADTLKVILVEPSRAQAGIIRRYLQADGIEQVVVVGSGKDALAAIEADRPDAVVSALHLSDMTGVQLAQQIRGACPGVVPGFVLISSEAESSDAGSLSKYGKGMVLKKPFTPVELAEALSLVVGPSADPPMSVAADAEPRVELGKLRVLVVDDSATARLYVRQVLASQGVERIVEAADGAQAVAALAGDALDLIVTDYNMPFMDGRGLVGYLKQNPATAQVPIIMCTTETDEAKLQSIRQLGVTVCDKSLPVDVVRSVTDRIVRGP